MNLNYMKRILLSVLIVFFGSIELKAQMQKGSWMLEGSGGLSRSRTYNPDIDEKPNPVSGLTLYPKAGFFVSDNFAIGLSGLLGTSWSRNPNYDPNILNDYKKGSTLDYGAGLFFRKYAPINEHISFFGEIGSEFFWTRQKSVLNEPTGTTTEVQRRTISFNGTLGVQYLFSPKVGVHLQTNLLHYGNVDELDEFGTVQKNFRAGFLINPQFGFTIFL